MFLFLTYEKAMYSQMVNRITSVLATIFDRPSLSPLLHLSCSLSSVFCVTYILQAQSGENEALSSSTVSWAPGTWYTPGQIVYLEKPSSRSVTGNCAHFMYRTHSYFSSDCNILHIDSFTATFLSHQTPIAIRCRSRPLYVRIDFRRLY